MTDKRTFVLEGSSIGFEGSHLTGKTPGAAARKAARILFKAVETDKKYKSFGGQNVLQFIIRETTRTSKHKTLAYSAHKVELKDPIELKHLPRKADGEYVKVFFQYKAYALRESELHTPLRKKLIENNSKL